MTGNRTPTGRVRSRRLTAIVGAALLASALTILLLPVGGSAKGLTAPSNTSLPTISGTTTKGNTLSATSGSWSGTTPFTYSYHWQRCDSDGANCSPVAGATSSTYALGSSDVGKRMRVEVTATNTDGSAAALSSATAAVAAAKPVNTVEPTISGSLVEGQTLSATTGSWSGDAPITYSYQWVRCGSDGGAADGSNCATPGATTSTYKLDDDDIGSRIRVRVTATNGAGSTTVASDATAPVAAKAASGPPVNTAEPRLSGTATQGRALTATPGSWTGAAPITFAYQWVRCGTSGGKADGSDCPAIGGATKSSYTLGAGDVGKRLRARVTGKNASGSKTVASNPTAVVGAAAPSGTITLSNGERSISVSSLPATESLVVDQVRFSPNPVRSKQQPITVRIKVKDTRGYVVRDALVFIRSTPKVTSGGDDRRTATDGWISYTLVPERDFPIRRGYSVQFYVKAYRAGDPVLGGVAGTRLVQVATAR